MRRYDLEEMYEFLDDMRDIGLINMHAAPAYLQQAFPMSDIEARDVVRKWMDTYQARNGGHFNTVPFKLIPEDDDNEL